MANTASSARALNAILPLISAGQPYEAHQKARTFASRYQKSGQYDTAIDVLFQSARELLKAGQQGSGADLAAFLLDVYENKGEEVNDDSRGRLTQLIALTGSSGAWRKTIIDKALAWSASSGGCPSGDSTLQHYVGDLLYKEGAFEAAEVHYLTAGKRDSARMLARMYVEWSSTGGSPGAFALRGTIPLPRHSVADFESFSPSTLHRVHLGSTAVMKRYLLNGNILAARAFMSDLLAQISATRSDFRSPLQPSPIAVGKTDGGAVDEIILTIDPLVNFSQLAIRVCQRAQGDKNKAARESWIRLCGTYQSGGGPLAAKDVRKVLHELSELYFAFPPPRGQQGHPLGDMLSAMLGGAPAKTSAAKRVLTPAPVGGGPVLD